MSSEINLKDIPGLRDQVRRLEEREKRLEQLYAEGKELQILSGLHAIPRELTQTTRQEIKSAINEAKTAKDREIRNARVALATALGYPHPRQVEEKLGEMSTNTLFSRLESAVRYRDARNGADFLRPVD